MCAPTLGTSVLGFGLAIPVAVQWSLVSTSTQNLFLNLYQAQHGFALWGVAVGWLLRSLWSQHTVGAGTQ